MSGFSPLKEVCREFGLETSAYMRRLEAKFEGCVQTYRRGVSSALACYLVQMTALGWESGLGLTIANSSDFTLLAPDFELKYQAQISLVRNALLTRISANSVFPLSVLAEELRLQITVFIPTHNKTERYTCSHPGRQLRVSLLDYDGQSVLITKKLKKGLERVKVLEAKVVLELEWKPVKEVVHFRANFQESETQVSDVLKNALSLVVTVLKRLKSTIVSDSRMKLCRDSGLANCLITLYSPLLRLRAHPVLKEHPPIQAFFTQLCQELASFQVAYHFVLSCERPGCTGPGLVDGVMEGCGHQVCRECLCQLVEREGSCFCGTQQTIETLKQDWELYQAVAKKRRNQVLCCYACNREKPLSFFLSPSCCDYPTCRPCLNVQTDPSHCQFCHRDITSALQSHSLVLPCSQCGASQDSPSYCPKFDILCHACQFQSICLSACVKCQAPYSDSSLLKLQKQLKFPCFVCGEIKTWPLMVHQPVCNHLLCMTCHLTQYVENCMNCGLPFCSEIYSKCLESAWDLACVSCQNYIPATEANIHHLPCKHLVHSACIPTLMEKSQFRCTRCKAEIDQSIVIAYREWGNVGKYIEGRGLEWIPVCSNACKTPNTAILLPFNSPGEWICTVCTQKNCALCGEKWDNYHEIGICPFSLSYRRIQALERVPGKAAAQCPMCLYVTELDSSCIRPAFTCENCKITLCSDCCVAEEGIRTHGIAYHRESCQFYPRFMGEMQVLRCERCQDRLQPCPKPANLKVPRQFTPQEYRSERTSPLAIL